MDEEAVWSGDFNSLKEALIAAVVTILRLPEQEDPKWEFRYADPETHVTGRRLTDDDLFITPNFAVFLNGKPVAVVQMHEDGSYGIYEVKNPEKIGNFSAQDGDGNPLGDVQMWEQMDAAPVAALLKDDRNDTIYEKRDDGLWYAQNGGETGYSPIDLTFGRNLEE